MTDLGLSRYTPDWQDAVNYRQAVLSNFNHVMPTVGLQWVSFESNGPAIPDSAISIAQENGLTVTGASVVWQRDRWPTPVEFRPGSLFDVQDFHDRLIEDRLCENGIMGRYSEAGAGPVITDWKVLNEPIHETAALFFISNLFAMRDRQACGFTLSEGSELGFLDLHGV